MCGCTEIPQYLELKELIAMYSSTGRHGGDLNTDTVTIIGTALDVQEKVVRQVSYASVACLSVFHPLTTLRLGDQRRLYALDRQ